MQCKIITRTAERLRKCAQHWITIDQGIDDGETAAPIEIIALCSVCLSAAASIHRLLSHNGRKSPVIRKRCEALMRLLGNPSLSAICSVAVRNSWEHLDERLDGLLSTRSFKSYSEIHVSVKPPDASTFLLRHFDPVRMEIKHGPDAVLLEPLIAEASELSGRVAKAFLCLHIEHCDVY